MYIQCVNTTDNFIAETSAERGPAMDLTYTTIANGELSFSAVSDDARTWIASMFGKGAVSFTVPQSSLMAVVKAAIDQNLICRMA